MALNESLLEIWLIEKIGYVLRMLKPRSLWLLVFTRLMMISILNRIGGVMGSVFASSAVNRGFEPRSELHKDYTIGICCFSAKHVALRRKDKDWLALNQNNVSEWNDMFTRELLFQWASTIKVQFSVLV